MADTVASIPASSGATRVAVLAGIASGLVGTAMFQALAPFIGANRYLEVLIMIIPVGVTFGVTMAWLGRRYARFGPVWATLMILAGPIVYFLAVMLAAQMASFANDMGLRSATMVFGIAGAAAGAAAAGALLMITVLRRRNALVGSAMVVVVGAIVGGIVLPLGFSEQGSVGKGYYIIHAGWQAVFLSSFMFTIGNSQAR